MVSAKAHAITTDRGAGILIERLDLVSDIATEEDTEIFHELEGKAAGKALQVFGA